jgi:hypothetical protein
MRQGIGMCYTLLYHSDCTALRYNAYCHQGGIVSCKHVPLLLLLLQLVDYFSVTKEMVRLQMQQQQRSQQATLPYVFKRP